MIFSAKLSRYLLVVTFIIVVSIVLPKFYSMLFYKSYNGPRVYFSPISEIFLLTKYNGKEVIRVDKSGKIYSREEFESLTPLFNYRQLLYRNEMPDSIKGILIDIQDVKLNNVFFSIKPSDIFRYLVPLNPLIESAPGRPDIQMPKEFFRIDDKMEFINCKTNEIDEDFSNLFNNKLFENEFSFPAKGIYGNPTTKKPFDEGYFVIDKSNNLFHIKQINNMPFVRKVEIPKGIKIDYIYLKESNLKEFYVLFITNENKIFIVSYDDYKIIEMPSEGYDRKEMQLVFMGNKFYRELNFISNNHIKTIVTDRSYKTIDIYEEIKKRNAELAEILLGQKIRGIFSSPPYVGLIDYHEQHAYAYEIFGFKRRDELEIGPLFKGWGKEARDSYIQGITEVLENCKKYLQDDYEIFLVANDKSNLYPKIAELAGMKIVNQFKRPVLNRVEKDRDTAYAETIFHLKER